MKYKELNQFKIDGTECWVFRDTHLTDQIYPILLEVRNGIHYPGGTNHAIFLSGIPLTMLTKADEEEMRNAAIEKVAGWRDIEKKEIHVVKAGMPGIYEDNKGNRKSLEEWAEAPEILAYNASQTENNIGRSIEADIKDVTSIIRECRKMLEQASHKSRLIRNPVEEYSEAEDDGLGPTEHALSNLVNELWNNYFLLRAVLSKKKLIR